MAENYYRRRHSGRHGSGNRQGGEGQNARSLAQNGETKQAAAGPLQEAAVANERENNREARENGRETRDNNRRPQSAERRNHDGENRRGDRQDRPGRSENRRSDRQDGRGDRQDRTDRQDRADRSDRAEKQDRPDRPTRAERRQNADRAVVMGGPEADTDDLPIEDFKRYYRAIVVDTWTYRSLWYVQAPDIKKAREMILTIYLKKGQTMLSCYPATRDQVLLGGEYLNFQQCEW